MHHASAHFGGTHFLSNHYGGQDIILVVKKTRPYIGKRRLKKLYQEDEEILLIVKAFVETL